MPSGLFADSSVVEFLRKKVVGDNLLLLEASAFFNVRIVVVRFGHRSISPSMGGGTFFAKPANDGDQRLAILHEPHH